jgi:prophage antirepressor-like protein
MNERVIIATKFRPKTSPGMGLISAIAEEIDGRLVAITAEDFCPTKQVFVVSKYEDIESKFRHGELFRIRVELMQPSIGQVEKSGAQCKFKTSGMFVEKLTPSELVDVVQTELPDRNSRILELNQLPSTAYIMMMNKAGECYGPMEWEDRSHNEGDIAIELKFITGGGLGRAGRTKQITKNTYENIKQNLTEVSTPAGKKYILENVISITNASGFEEYASDVEIIDYVKSIAGDAAGRLIDRKSMATLSTMAGNTRQSGDQLPKRRIALFNEIFVSNAENLEAMNAVFDTYLKSEKGTELVESYVQANRGRYIDKLKNDIEFELEEKIKRSQEELRLLREELDVRRKESIDLSDDIEAKRKEIETGILNDQQAYLEKVSKEIQTRINALNQEEEAAKVRIATIRSSLTESERIADFRTLINQQEGALNYLKKQADIASKELNALRDETRLEDDDLRKRLRGMKPYVEHINGPFATGDIIPSRIQVACAELSAKDPIFAQRAIIDSIRERMSALGRSFSDAEVANLLISTQQSFITFLAGLPGVGKTSLCSLFADAQGTKDRMHNVAVARGWTSTKDMIGFHNPLSDQFQPATTGLYEYLLALDEEASGNGINPMAYILLDEANLSSIEHYWSTFMGMADSTTDHHQLNLGQKILTIPKSLRFLATINYDGTTEPLSPRVLDRASVIVMQPGDVTLCQGIDSEKLQALPISSADMDSLFGLFNEAPELQPHEKSALEAIHNVLRNPASEHGRPIHISQRKIHAIRQYCARAGSIMRSSGNEFTALDWAVTQHVLPQVRGHGNKFANRLAELRKKLDANGLELASDYLGQMVAYGQNDLHSYDFFCW